MILIVLFRTQHCEYKPFGWNIGNVGEFFLLSCTAIHVKFSFSVLFQRHFYVRSTVRFRLRRLWFLPIFPILSCLSPERLFFLCNCPGSRRCTFLRSRMLAGCGLCRKHSLPHFPGCCIRGTRCLRLLPFRPNRGSRRTKL